MPLSTLWLISYVLIHIYSASFFLLHLILILQTFIDAECDMWTFGILLCTQLLFVNSLHLAFLVQLWVINRYHHAYHTYRNPLKTIPMVVSIVGSIALFFFFALLYNLLVTPEWAVKVR